MSNFSFVGPTGGADRLGIQQGDKNGNWKGGRRQQSQGYILIWKPDHPFADVDGYVREHRLVWEKYHKAILLPCADIHHVNGHKQDNRIENLEPLIHDRHTSLTHIKDMSNRYCANCESNKTVLEKGKFGTLQHWRRHPEDKEKWLCHKCYQFWRRHGSLK